MSQTIKPRQLSERLSFALAVIVLLIAAVLRFVDYTELPGGLSGNELAQVELMRDHIKQGDISVFYEGSGRGQEGLYHMVLAMSTLIFGTGTIGFRLPSLLAGMIAVALMYSLGTRLYGRLAALIAAIVMAITLWAALLSRLVTVEAVLPMVITAALLALARAMPVYERARLETTNTRDFAWLGILLGLSLYIHPSGLMVVLGAMAFIAYIVILLRPLSLRWLSYIGFTILMMLIVSIPYLLSTLRLDELNAGGRVFGNFGSITISSIQSIIGIALRGDSDPTRNIPFRPLIDVVSGFFMVVGVIIAARQWRQPRYMLVLIMGAFLALPAFLADDAPNFAAMTVLLPVIALLVGLGIATLVENLPTATRRYGVVAVLVLVSFNVVWTSYDLLVRWKTQEAVEIAYNSDIGQIARYLDQTASEIPTVLCYPDWNEPQLPDMPLSAAEEVLLLLNNNTAKIRHVDCRNGFLFTNGGARQQVVIPSANIYNNLPPDIADWIALSTPVDDLPERSVVIMDVKTLLADALGVYTTTSPASYVNEADVSSRIPIPPPIRFGGNLTWLGYESDPLPQYSQDSIVPVTTYWRMEGLVPSDLRIFTHILSDPITIVANQDTIFVNPEHLRERDVYIHSAFVPLDANLPPRTYEISVGAYQTTSDIRLNVFAEEGVVRGNRIFLYDIDVVAPE